MTVTFCVLMLDNRLTSSFFPSNLEITFPSNLERKKEISFLNAYHYMCQLNLHTADLQTDWSIGYWKARINPLLPPRRLAQSQWRLHRSIDARRKHFRWQVQAETEEFAPIPM